MAGLSAWKAVSSRATHRQTFICCSRLLPAVSRRHLFSRTCRHTLSIPCRIANVASAMYPIASLGLLEPQRMVSYLTDPANTGKRARGVNFDTLGSWNNRLDLAINMEESIRRGKLIPLISLDAVGIASLRGRRQENEDRTIICELAPSLLMFGIFDGHGGPDAADYVVEQLPVHIKYWLECGETDFTVILRRAFIDVNNGYTRDIYHRYIAGLSLNT